MISQRRAAQVGLLAAMAVIVTSVGILVSSGEGDGVRGATPGISSGSQSVIQSSDSGQRSLQAMPVSLSAASDSGTSAELQR
jgi:hypothetical protein